MPASAASVVRGVGPAAARLVQGCRRSFGAPVREDPAQVLRDRARTPGERRRIPDRGMLLGDPFELLRLGLRHDCDVSDLAEAEQGGIELEDLDRLPDDLVDRRREVEVPHDPARDAGGACADALLVEHDDVGSGTALLLEQLGEVVGGREPVDPSADDDIRG